MLARRGACAQVRGTVACALWWLLTTGQPIRVAAMRDWAPLVVRVAAKSIWIKASLRATTSQARHDDDSSSIAEPHLRVSNSGDRVALCPCWSRFVQLPQGTVGASSPTGCSPSGLPRADRVSARNAYASDGIALAHRSGSTATTAGAKSRWWRARTKVLSGRRLSSCAKLCGQASRTGSPRQPPLRPTHPASRHPDPRSAAPEPA